MYFITAGEGGHTSTGSSRKNGLKTGLREQEQKGGGLRFCRLGESFSVLKRELIKDTIFKSIPGLLYPVALLPTLGD